MNRQSQWLFEAPPVLEATHYTNPYANPEYYNPELEDEWETEWELQEANPYGLGEEEWEARGSSINKKIQAHRSAHLNLQRAIQATEKFITKKNGRIHFTLPIKNAADMANKLRIGHQAASKMLNSLKATNHKLHVGKINFSRIRVRTKLGSSVNRMSSINREASGCAGKSAVETYWWGNKSWINDCDTRTVINVMKAGGALGTILPSLEAKAVAAVTAAGGFTIDAINAQGGNLGIIVWSPWVGPPVIWHQ
jgi:hypothetical protein